MRSNYKKLGEYIRQVDVRNKEEKVTTLLGVSISKKFIPSIANTIGTDMSKYKIVMRKQFAYGPVTSRNGDKISIALLEEKEAICSVAYTVFEVTNEEQLDPEYLMMWFRRPEFDRYARYKSHGSARETFDWEEMCNVELPLPSIEKQREIVAEYNTVVNRMKLNETLCEKLEETAQTIYKQWFEEFEFPNDEGKPYKSSDGEMEWCEELGKEVPKGWEVKKINKIISVKDGTHDSPTPVDHGYPLVTSKNLNPYDISFDDTYFISERDYQQINKRSKVEQFDILFSMIGTVGIISYIFDEKINYAIKNVGLFKTSELVTDSMYILFYLKGRFAQEYINSSLSGSTQTYISLTDLRAIPLLMPSNNITLLFNRNIDPVLKYVKTYVKERKLLVNTENLLLSKMAI